MDSSNYETVEEEINDVVSNYLGCNNIYAVVASREEAQQIVSDLDDYALKRGWRIYK